VSVIEEFSMVKSA